MSNGSGTPGSTQTPGPDDDDMRLERIGYDAAYEAGYERGYQSGFKAGTDVGQKITAKQERARGYKEGYDAAKGSQQDLKPEEPATHREGPKASTGKKKPKKPGSRKKPE